MKGTKLRIIQSKDELFCSYKSYNPVFVEILQQMEKILKKVLKIQSVPTFKARIKKFDSYYRKVTRFQPEALSTKDFPVLSDLLGIRIICPFLDDLAIVEKIIKEKFCVLEIERKGSERSFSEFGYESVHILVEIPKKIKDSFKDGDLPKNLICEIQVRTILQDAWAEVEHELVYKSSFSPFDLPLRRKLASMNASLSLADIIFQEIRDYQRKLNDELAFRRENFYLQADLLGKEKLTVENEINREMGAYKSINSPSPYVKGTIDDYLLEAIHAQNSGENELAVEIYSRIIHSQPEQSKQVLSVIYKHRGMAYFAMHNYKLAIDDFSKSVDYDKNNYRSMYYCGIVLSVINDDEKALDYFDKSLLVNPYQAHVNYRRAMSLYRLGNNTDALGALDEARRLGLDDEEAKQLHELLEKELGVKK